jgi:hypothetical protein
MALGLDVATLARAWTSLDFAWKPPSGDGSYDWFKQKQVPLGVSPRINLTQRISPEGGDIKAQCAAPTGLKSANDLKPRAHAGSRPGLFYAATSWLNEFFRQPATLQTWTELNHRLDKSKKLQSVNPVPSVARRSGLLVRGQTLTSGIHEQAIQRFWQRFERAIFD